MASILVAGRVDADVAKRTQFVIEKSGTTQAEVIRYVWQKISDTGQVPLAQQSAAQKESLDELQALKQISPKTDYLESLTPQGLKSELAGRGLNDGGGSRERELGERKKTDRKLNNNMKAGRGLNDNKKVSRG